MNDPKLTVIGNPRGVISVNPDNLAMSVYDDLVKDEIVEPVNFETDVTFDLDYVQAGELPLGSMSESEKRTFLIGVYIGDILDDFLRSKNADVAERYAERIRDKKNSVDQIMRETLGTMLDDADQQLVMRLSQSARMVHDLWSYNVKKRFNNWNVVGVRKNWILVSYPPKPNRV